MDVGTWCHLYILVHFDFLFALQLFWLFLQQNDGNFDQKVHHVFKNFYFAKVLMVLLKVKQAVVVGKKC